MSERSEPVRVGLLGCGTVGSALVRLVSDHADLLAERAGAPVEITRIGVRDTSRSRDVPVDRSVFTDDLASIVTHTDVDIVVEVMGGVDPAGGLLVKALEAGKPVVTANKELVATRGAELFSVASTVGVDLLFEASVGGGIPLIRPLRESLAGDRITRLLGIVNGTTNYILTRMTEEGSSFADALAEAQDLGYAEPDPTADIEGMDAAAKAAIIASIAFGTEVTAADVHREGITAITTDDITAARDLGYVIKPLAVAQGDQDSVSASTYPAMVPVHHPLASVRGAFNALFVEGDAVGEVMLYGPGAGGSPTASALLGDIVDAARNHRSGASAAVAGAPIAKRIRPIDDTESQFYLSLDVEDRPGVLARIAGIFGEHGVSILSMRQHGLGDDARLTFVTHRAREAALRATVDAAERLDAVRTVGSVLRVIGDDT